jgi:uncharacterized Rmd1/YagE family protein
MIPASSSVRFACNHSDERLLVVADALAKSTVLSHDERRVSAVFDIIEPFAQELASMVERQRIERRS